MKRAKEYLTNVAPSIEGEGGNLHGYNVACKLNDFGISPDLSFELMDEWNDRCLPPWSDVELRTLIRNATRYKQNSAGSEKPISAAMILNTMQLKLILYKKDQQNRFGEIVSVNAAEVTPRNIEYIWKNPTRLRVYIRRRDRRHGQISNHV